MNTTYWKNKIMSDTFIDTQNEFYVGLSSTAPDTTGAGATEPGAGVGYTRVKITSFSSPADGVVRNRNTLSFPVSTGVWFNNGAKASYWVMFDGARSNANVLAWGPLTNPKEIEADAQVAIGSGAIRITLQDSLQT